MAWHSGISAKRKSRPANKSGIEMPAEGAKRISGGIKQKNGIKTVWQHRQQNGGIELVKNNKRLWRRQR